MNFDYYPEFILYNSSVRISSSMTIKGCLKEINKFFISLDILELVVVAENYRVYGGEYL